MSLFIKKDYSNWVFGIDDGGGTKFSGNIWYLFKYVNENCKDIRSVCMTKSESNYNIITSNGYKAIKPNTFKSLVTILKSGVCIISGEFHYDLQSSKEVDFPLAFNLMTTNNHRIG